VVHEAPGATASLAAVGAAMAGLIDNGAV
jgi:hypothetical protein